MIDSVGSYVANLIYLFIFECNYSLKWFLVNLERRKKIKVMGSGPILTMSLLKYV